MSTRKASQRKQKITLIQSEKTGPAVQKQLAPQKGKPVELWIRQPDADKLDRLSLKARLCRCKKVCVAVFEDGI